MARYYVDRKPLPGGEHEVHRAGCSFMPPSRYRLDLGDHITCHSAVERAQLHYGSVTGCLWCARACRGD